jgi:hypothetical protein
VVTEHKYAVVERERRLLLAEMPSGLGPPILIKDRYLTGTRLRLREMTEGAVTRRKLGHKVPRPDGGIAHTSLYLDDSEWTALSVLPGALLIKCRHRHPSGWVVDVHESPHPGLVLAEYDRGEGAEVAVPADFLVVRDVTDDPSYEGGSLAIGRRG